MGAFPLRQWLFSTNFRSWRRLANRGSPGPARGRCRGAMLPDPGPLPLRKMLKNSALPVKAALVPPRLQGLTLKAAASRYSIFKEWPAKLKALEAPPRRLDLCKETEAPLQDPVSIFSKLVSGLRTEVRIAADEWPYRGASCSRQGRCCEFSKTPRRRRVRVLPGRALFRDARRDVKRFGEDVMHPVYKRASPRLLPRCGGCARRRDRRSTPGRRAFRLPQQEDDGCGACSCWTRRRAR